MLVPSGHVRTYAIDMLAKRLHEVSGDYDPLLLNLHIDHVASMSQRLSSST